MWARRISPLRKLPYRRCAMYRALTDRGCTTCNRTTWGDWIRHWWSWERCASEPAVGEAPGGLGNPADRQAAQQRGNRCRWHEIVLEQETEPEADADPETGQPEQHQPLDARASPSGARRSNGQPERSDDGQHSFQRQPEPRWRERIVVGAALPDQAGTVAESVDGAMARPAAAAPSRLGGSRTAAGCGQVDQARGTGWSPRTRRRPPLARSGARPRWRHDVTCSWTSGCGLPSWAHRRRAARGPSGAAEPAIWRARIARRRWARPGRFPRLRRRPAPGPWSASCQTPGRAGRPPPRPSGRQAMGARAARR